MKTLILNGSPKKNGDTSALIDEFVRHLDGEVRILSHADNLSPCVDCRYCWSHDGCAIHDGMHEIYRWLELCDNVVLASPVWFSSLSGVTLNLASRFQTLFAARQFRGETSEPTKNGVLMLVGARAGSEVAAEKSANIILSYLGVKRPLAAIIRAMDTDRLSVCDDASALAKAREAAEILNGINKK